MVKYIAFNRERGITAELPAVMMVADIRVIEEERVATSTIVFEIIVNEDSNNSFYHNCDKEKVSAVFKGILNQMKDDSVKIIDTLAIIKEVDPNYIAKDYAITDL